MSSHSRILLGAHGSALAKRPPCPPGLGWFSCLSCRSCECPSAQSNRFSGAQSISDDELFKLSFWLSVSERKKTDFLKGFDSENQ
eukprot:scaffold6070_cov295-Pinguiococcus_pyrenoidosus.AAC.6